MKKTVKYFKHSLIFVMLISVNVFSQTIGSKAPEFSASDLNGNNISLNQFKGQVVLIDFWASWCVPCKKSMPHIIELYNNRSDSSFTVIAVNVDEEKSKIDEFAKSINAEFPFPVVFDKESKLPALFEIEGMPRHRHGF